MSVTPRGGMSHTLYKASDLSSSSLSPSPVTITARHTRASHALTSLALHLYTAVDFFLCLGTCRRLPDIQCHVFMMRTFASLLVEYLHVA